MKNSPNVIWSANCSREIDQYVAFRKSFVTESDGILNLTLFANTYYNLYVDGNFIHRGPVRRHEKTAEYDEIQCYLTKGEHTVAVLVHWLGNEFAAHRKVKPSFWLEADGCGISISTDDTWKAKFLDAFHTDGDPMTCYDFREDIDLRELPYGWNNKSCDDSSWDNAIVICKAGSDEDFFKNYKPRQMKLFSYIWEKAQILKTGRYTENLSEKEYFFDRLVARTLESEGKDGSFCVAGIESTASGTVLVNYTDAKDGDELILGYDDKLDEKGFVNPERISRYGDRFILSEGDGSIEIFMPRGLRYIIAELSGKGTIESLSVRKEEYPYLPNGISIGDSYFSTLYEQCIRTQHICTIDGYTDCLTRERVLWVGDAWIDTMSAYYAEPDKGLLLTTMFEHAMGQVESGAIGGYNASDLQPEWLHMNSYNLMYLHMLCDYILFTGKDDILPLKDTAKKIFQFVTSNINEDGLYDTRHKGYGDFWDWGYADAPGQSLKTNAFLIYTIERYAKFKELRDIVEEYIPMIEPLKKKCFKLFWNEDRRVFNDGCLKGEKPDQLSTQQANALAVLSGICPDEICDELLEKITDPKELDEVPTGAFEDGKEFVPNKEKILPPGTMFAAMFVCMALFEKGRYDIGLKYMREVWGPFKDLPTLPELRFNGHRHTMCHGWSGGPGYLIPRYLLGLFPDTYAWKSTTLVPPAVDASEFPSAGGRISTPYGDMIVQWVADKESLKVSTILPEDIELRVLWQDKDVVLKGKSNIYIIK